MRLSTVQELMYRLSFFNTVGAPHTVMTSFESGGFPPVWQRYINGGSWQIIIMKRLGIMTIMARKMQISTHQPHVAVSSQVRHGYCEDTLLIRNWQNYVGVGSGP